MSTCCCMGPAPGQPLCRCMMRAIQRVEGDNDVYMVRSRRKEELEQSGPIKELYREEQPRADNTF